MLNLNLNNAQVTGTYNEYSPIPKGQYQVIISEASIDEGVSSAKSKTPNTPRTLLKLKFDVFGGGSDGGNRPMYDMIMYEYGSSDPKHVGMVEKNKAKLTDLLLQIIAKKYNGDASQSPFNNGFGAENVGYLVDSNLVLLLDIEINKKSQENEVASYYPEDKQSQQNQGMQQGGYQQNNQQPMQNQGMQQNNQPVQNGGQNMGNGQAQSQNVQHSQNAGAQQTAGSHFNRPAFMQQQNR